MCQISLLKSVCAATPKEWRVMQSVYISYLEFFSTRDRSLLSHLFVQLFIFISMNLKGFSSD